VGRAVTASPALLEGSPMDFLLKIRNDLVAEIPVGSAKYAIQYTSGWFVVWVEGRDEIVDAATERARVELGSKQKLVLHRSVGAPTLHDRVIVATTQTPLAGTGFAKWVMHMRDVGPSMEPSQIWGRLGAPCLIDPNLGTPPRHQFAVIAADDHGPVDQLRKLSEKFHSPIVYQRFGVAQMRTPDMGTAYVDLPGDDGAARVRVLSGRAMERASVRNSMPAVEALVVILGKRPPAMAELARNMAKAVEKSGHVPHVWLAGAEGEASRACSQVLAEHGIRTRAIATVEGGGNLLALLKAAGLHVTL
jgi:hypothetical protein